MEYVAKMECFTTYQVWKTYLKWIISNLHWHSVILQSVTIKGYILKLWSIDGIPKKKQSNNLNRMSENLESISNNLELLSNNVELVYDHLGLMFNYLELP